MFLFQRCDEKQLYQNLMGPGFLILFCLALVGNCLNLVSEFEMLKIDCFIVQNIYSVSSF